MQKQAQLTGATSLRHTKNLDKDRQSMESSVSIESPNIVYLKHHSIVNLRFEIQIWQQVSKMEPARESCRKSRNSR